MVEAAVNTIEFSLRENNTGSYPRGLALLLNALATWSYGRDPLVPIRYEAPMADVKELLATEQAYLPGLIKEHLLDNRHRSVVIIKPDSDLAQRQEEAETARLAAARAQMTEEDLLDTVANTQELRRLQEMPDSAEALAALPLLTLDDLRS